MICPKCKSTNVSIVDYAGSVFVKCNTCFYDESELMDEYAEEKTSQKAKATYSKYKTGGPRRTVKKK